MLFAFRVVFILYEDRNLPELVCEKELHLHMNPNALTIPTTGNFSSAASNLYRRHRRNSFDSFSDTPAVIHPRKIN